MIKSYGTVKYQLEIKYCQKHLKRLQILNGRETLARVSSGKSIARFGDGEFGMMTRVSNIGFQQYDPILANELIRVMSEENDDVLLCIPHYLTNFDGAKKETVDYWKQYLNKHAIELYSLLKTCNKTKYTFGDALVTRPYIDYSDSDNAFVIYRYLKELLMHKKVLIVEGDRTCIGVGNDLLDGTESVRRIVCPNENAFSLYQKILVSVLNNWKNEIVLIALGPTATVLANDLSKKGIQAFDIGHIDTEYEWYVSGAKCKQSISGKYVNGYNTTLDDVNHDNLYLESIVERIK